MTTFGYSVGDFVAVVGLINTVVRSLRTAGGAKDVYRELCKDLECLVATLRRVQSLELEGRGAEVEHLQRVCVACLDKIYEFGKKMHKFQSTLKDSTCGDPLHEAKRVWHKIEWGVLREDQIKEFKAALTAPLQSVAIAQQHILLHQGNLVIGSQAQQNDLMRQILGSVQELKRSLSNDIGDVSQRDIGTKPWPCQDFDSKVRESLPAETGLGDVATAFRVGADFEASDCSLRLSQASPFNVNLERHYNSMKYKEEVSPRTSCFGSFSTTVGVSVKETWPQKINSIEQSELLLACQERKTDILKLLLQSPDISLEATDEQGHSVLHVALGSGKVNTDKSKMIKTANIVRLLSTHGADVNATDKSGHCPIHYCAQTINSEAAKYLLEHGARINEPDLKGRTALNYTAMDSHPDVEFVKMLVARGGRLGMAKLPKLPPRANESQKEVRRLVAKL